MGGIREDRMDQPRDVTTAGSYFMKQFCSRLAVLLVAISAVGLAQEPKTEATPAPSTQPASSSPTPAIGPQTVAAPASGVNTGGPIDPERYVIGAEDSLQITVWKEPTL